MRILSLIACLFFASAPALSPLAAQEDNGSGFSVDTMVCTDPNTAWDAVFSEAGMAQLGIDQFLLEPHPGGRFMRRVGDDGQLGDANTIIEEVLAIDIGRMIALKSVQMPGIDTEIMKTSTSIYYFTPVAPDRTLIRVVSETGSTDQRALDLQALAQSGTEAALEVLRARFSADCSQTRE